MHRASLFTAITAMTFASPATAEVNQKFESGFVIRHAADLPVSPDAAWEALIKPADWWSKAHTWSGDAANLSIDPRAGGCFCEVLPVKDSPRAAPRGGVEHMRVVYAERGRALRMSGLLGPLQSEALVGTLTISLKPAESGTGTRILWEYVVGGTMRYKVDQISAAVDGVLGEQSQWLALKLGGSVAATTLPAAAPVQGPPKPADAAGPGR